MDAFVAHGYLEGMEARARHIIQPYTRRVPADKAWMMPYTKTRTTRSSLHPWMAGAGGERTNADD